MEELHINEEEEAHKHIQEIQKSYLNMKGRVLDSLAGAMWIVEKMFTHTGHFILEFIQNAEDAKATKVKIILSPEYIEIFNNGRPFSREDVEAICAVGRSHKDPGEYVGYLGVGFKAVFLISTKCCVYSQPYRFKFDKDAWFDPRSIPWQIIPIWLDEIPEEYKKWNVVFRIYIDKEGYERVKNELQNLTLTTLLFLHYITEIEINFEGSRRVFRKHVRGDISTLEEEKDGSKTSTVPENIRNDKFTKDWNRDIVEKRELAVAFMLNENGDLVPTTGTVKFGVFSYVPLKEEKVGMDFLIHGDFLVSPGREMVLRETPWNLWMLEELADFVINSVIESFKKHEQWKFSYANVLYSNAPHPPFNELAHRINKTLEEGDHLVDIRGNFIKASEAISVSDHLLELLSVEFLEKLTNKKVLHPKTKFDKFSVDKISDTRSLKVFEKLEDWKKAFGDKWREALKEFAIALAKEWFNLLPSTKEKYQHSEQYYRRIFLTEEDELCSPKDIYIPDPPEVEQKIKEKFGGKYKFLHNILREKLIIDYLREVGAKILTEKDVYMLINEETLPSLLDKLKNPNTPDNEKIEIVKKIKELWKENVITTDKLSSMEILIRTKNGKWVRPKEAYLSSEYEPEFDIEKLIKN
ncbi:MAG: hypothetical protein QXI58_08105, partial [Candidatus Micrarchaeia archaeon]